VLGDTVKLSGGSVEDPGYISDVADEALRLSLDWGDGSTEIMDLFMPGPLSIPPSHKYAAVGTYHITLKATDNDMGETVQMFDVVVSPPPPPAASSRVASSEAVTTSSRWAACFRTFATSSTAISSVTRSTTIAYEHSTREARVLIPM
jgi:hypothetical protein